MPEVIEISIFFRHGERIRTMITPDNPNFTIHPEATKVNGWTREKLLDLPLDQRPTLD